MRPLNLPPWSSASSNASSDVSSDGSPAGKRRKTDQDEPIPEVVKGIMKRFPYCDLAEGVMVSYHYQNITLGEPPRKLYTYRGEVSFETDKGSTPFHGEFQRFLYERRGGESDLHLKFTFHWRGNRRYMKTTKVVDCGMDDDSNLMYRGKDSSNRSIRMVNDGKAMWCNTCECWHWDEWPISRPLSDG